MQVRAAMGMGSAFSHDGTNAKKHLTYYKGPFAQANFL